jgi:hypothetical protein
MFASFSGSNFATEQQCKFLELANPRAPPAFLQPGFTRSVQEIARCNAIEVGKTVIRAGSKIEAYNQVEQELMGAIRNRDRQRFLVKSFDIVADEAAQQAAQGPLSGLVAAQSREFLLEGLEGP